MKIRVIGDLHGRDWWKRKVETGDSDLNIFLGDYVDSYTVSDKQIINNLLDIIEFKKSYEDKVILLLGNHEYNYISPYIGYCSGYRYSISNKLQGIYRNNLHLFKLNHNIKIYNPETEKIDRTYWFSHAGITSKWLSFYGQIFNNIENENGRYVVKYVKYYLFGFIPMWRWLKKKCPFSLDEEVVEFQHKESAHNIMLDYYELARHDYNVTKIKNKTL